MIPFQCPYCGLTTQVDDQYAGQSGPCAGCGRMITVPPRSTTPPSAPTPSRRLPPWLSAALAVSATLLVVAVIGSMLWRLLPSSVRHVRTAARQSTCQSHVELLLRALYAYRNDYGSFPPSYSVDSQGRPLHSWRVLLLPYLGPEAQTLHAQMNLNEAWNSPLNLRFAQSVPEVFVCPDDQPFAPGDTSYCVVTGAQYAFRPQTGVDADQFIDDPATTLLIVELHNSGINWMQPTDVSPTVLAQGLNSGVQGTCGSLHPGGVTMVGMADGRAFPLSDRTRPDDLHQMATIDGGEPPPALLRSGR